MAWKKLNTLFKNIYWIWKQQLVEYDIIFSMYCLIIIRIIHKYSHVLQETYDCESPSPLKLVMVMWHNLANEVWVEYVRANDQPAICPSTCLNNHRSMCWEDSSVSLGPQVTMMTRGSLVTYVGYITWAGKRAFITWSNWDAYLMYVCTTEKEQEEGRGGVQGGESRRLISYT
jgi:hypothetical protein